ncbi:MAG TPA: hypothetical protein VFE13_00110, partial [Caulobacteraceae bacterium]|nr:hypothetical protein [Caulobacteraceae bacterium]
MGQTDQRASAIARLVAQATRRPLAVAVAGLALAVAAMAFVATHFEINTNTDDLLSPKLAYRQGEAAFARLFPGSDTQIVVVVDGRTPELAEQGAQALADRLTADPAHFRSVRRPDGGEFWAKEGLLFTSPAQVKTSMERLIAAEPFLGPMAADPSLRGLMSSLDTALQGVSTGQTPLSTLTAPVTRLADALEKLEAGKPAFFSWRALIGGGQVDARELRKILLVDPVMDYTQLEPGAAAGEAIRADADALRLSPATGVTVRLTGPVPLEDEEFGSL